MAREGPWARLVGWGLRACLARGPGSWGRPGLWARPLPMPLGQALGSGPWAWPIGPGPWVWPRGRAQRLGPLAEPMGLANGPGPRLGAMGQARPKGQEAQHTAAQQTIPSSAVLAQTSWLAQACRKHGDHYRSHFQEESRFPEPDQSLHIAACPQVELGEDRTASRELAR